MDQPKYTLHMTDAKTFRVLVDGNVSPYLVGFQEPWQALHRLGDLEDRFPGAMLSIPDHMARGYATVVVAYFCSQQWREPGGVYVDHRELAEYVLGRAPQSDEDLLEVHQHLVATVRRGEEIGLAYGPYCDRFKTSEDAARRKASVDWHNLRDDIGEKMLVRPIALKR